MPKERARKISATCPELLILITSRHISWISVVLHLFQVRERVIRSQFACTYNDEELPLNRVLDFPSTSQVPTCVHPPKAKTTTSVNDGCSSDVEDSTKGKSLCYFSLQATPPYPTTIFYFFCTQQHVKCQNKTCCILSAGTDFCFLWRHTAGPRPRLTFSAPALEPSQLRPWSLLSPGLGAFSVPVVGLVLTTCC